MQRKDKECYNPSLTRWCQKRNNAAAIFLKNMTVTLRPVHCTGSIIQVLHQRKEDITLIPMNHNERASCASEKKFSFSYGHPLIHKKPINFVLLKGTLRHPLLLCHVFSPATCSGEILFKKINDREKKNWETLQYLILKDFCISTFH